MTLHSWRPKTHKMDTELAASSNTTVIGNLGSLTVLSGVGDKTDIVSDKFDTCTATPNFMQDNEGVIVETSKGLVWVPVSELVGVYGGTPTSTDIQNAATLLQQQDGLVDIQSNDVQEDHHAPVGDFTDVAETALPEEATPKQTVFAVKNVLTPKKRRGGWPKGKKRKKDTSDPNAPRAPVTGYVLFQMERRRSVKATNPSTPYSEVTRIIGKQWSDMPSEEKKKYLDSAEKDKQRYIEELKVYQQSESYQNYMKKKKLKTLGIDAADVNSDDLEASLIDFEDDELYCKVCNQYFSSLHNKKEHMFGKQHLNNITGHYEKELQEQESNQLDPGGALGSDILGATNSDQSLPGTSQSAQSAPVDIDSFVQGFLEKNYERELEIRQLRKSLAAAKDQNMALVNKISEVKEMESKLEQDNANLKAYGISLSAQIDGLKMVPTLFGVINF